jgi:hypothetical protein
MKKENFKMINLTDLQAAGLKASHNAAIQSAKMTADLEYSAKGDCGACGFAWVALKVDGRTPLAKMLKELGFQKSWVKGEYYLWNPAQAYVQSVDILSKGAQAYVKMMRELTGLDFYMDSRLD